MTDEELAIYYDTHSIMPDIIEAEKNGDVIVCKPGECGYLILKSRKEARKRAAAEAAAAATAAAATKRSVAAAIL